jgi:murein DD-endopeptidase MepM/ murein hydrolase activator NlpD
MRNTRSAIWVSAVCLLGLLTTLPAISVSASDQPDDLPETAGQATSTAEPTSTHLPGADLTFPSPAPLPVSAWRPPLYPVPWAAGPNDHFLFERPIAADEVNWPLPDYRYGGVYFGPNIVHTGIDIDAKTGTPVLAAGSGKVIWAGYGLFSSEGNRSDPYGMAVAIRHDFGYQGQELFTIYAHMSAIEVQKGDVVTAGQQIGQVGETGNVTGPHLHFEVRLGENSFFATRNPELWIAPPSGWGVLAGKITDDRGKPLTHVNLIIRSRQTKREWSVRTYGLVSVNPDDNLAENFVLSDLPPGDYSIYYHYNDRDLIGLVTIEPGRMAFVTMRGTKGFSTSSPMPVFTPAPAFVSP